MKVEEEQPEELQTLRKDLLNCFESMECFLLPYPGKGFKHKIFTSSRVNVTFKDELSQIQLSKDLDQKWTLSF